MNGEDVYGTIGTEKVTNERIRQIVEEGRTADSDHVYVYGELTAAAISYAMAAADLVLDPNSVPEFDDIKAHWPWNPIWWKPSKDPIRNLEKAGALICAEIDRLEALKK